MATIQFSNGTKVNFNGNPTSQDVEEVATKLGLNKPGANHPFNPNNPQSQANLDNITKGTSQNTTGNFFKALPTAVVDTAVGLPVRGAVSLGEGIGTTIKTGGKENASGKTYNIPGLQPFKSIQSASVDRAKQGQNPALNILQGGAEAALSAADTLGLAEGATKIPGLLSKLDVRAAGTAFDKASSSGAKDLLASAWEHIKPKTPDPESLQKTGLFGRVQSVPKGRDLEMAKTASPYLADAKDGFQARDNIQKAISQSVETVRGGLKESQGIWNENQLKGILDGVEKPITVKSDPTINRIADGFRKAAGQLAEKANKKTVGLLDLRQSLDKLIDSEFPQNIYTKDAPVGQYVRKIRAAINDFTESKIPDGKLPDGSSFKGELRKQSLLIDAKDNVLEKLPKEGYSNSLTQFIKNNPKTATAAGTAVGLTTAGTLLNKLGIKLP